MDNLVTSNVPTAVTMMATTRYPAWCPDKIYVTSKVQVCLNSLIWVGVDDDQIFPSDHAGLLADITFGGNESTFDQAVQHNLTKDVLKTFGII